MESSNYVTAISDVCYFIANKDGRALARDPFNQNFYFSDFWSDKIERWETRKEAEDALTFYQQAAERLKMFDDFKECKVARAIKLTTTTTTMIFEI